MNLREYRSEDCPRLMDLFWDSVHGAACRDYTPAQLDAWAPREMDGERWARTFSHHRTFVAEEGEKIWGFATLDGDYFDHLFVSSTAQRRGVARCLADRVEQTAKEQGFSRISVHASLTARPFFEKRGYRMLKEQQVERFGERLTNFVMEKDL